MFLAATKNYDKILKPSLEKEKKEQVVIQGKDSKNEKVDKKVNVVDKDTKQKNK
jgi:hypothetical protein